MEAADTLYAVAELAATGEEKAISVYSQPCLNFHRALLRLQRVIREADLGAELATEVGLLKRFRFLLCSTILPPKAIYDLLVSGRPSGKSSESVIGNVDIRAKFAEANECLRSVCALHQNPLVEAFLNHRPALNNNAVAVFHVPDAPFAPIVHKYLQQTPAFRIAGVSFVAASANELRGPRVYDLLVFCGAPQWLSYTDREYIFTAARAPELIVVCYSFMLSSELKFTPLDLERRGSDSPAIKFQIENEGAPDAQIDAKRETSLPITVEELIPRITLGAARSSELTPALGSTREEEISARLWLLGDSSAVFLEEPGESWMLEPKETGEGNDIQVRQNESLEPGQIIILTTSGAGDLIVPVANEMLGPAKDRYRQLQLNWKQRLRERIANSGAKAILNELRVLDAENLSEQNLFNWCSTDERKIGPGSDRTFEAVLQTVGLQSLAQEIISNAHALRSVRISAGHYLQTQLLAEFARADLEALRTKGAFAVHTSDGVASKTAYLLQERGSDLQPLVISRRSKPFHVGADLWR